MSSADALSRALEKELKCSICTELLFDPVVYLDCLHTNCGSCSKRWFETQTQPSCPVCRKVVREARPNVAFGSIIDGFLGVYPGKAREPGEIAAARRVYRPGQTVISGGAVESPTEQASSPASTTTSRSSVSSWADLVAPRSSTSTSRNTTAPPSWVDLIIMPPAPSTSTTTWTSRSTAAASRRGGAIAEIVATTGSSASIFCDSCAGDISNDLHYECTVCSQFHLCHHCHLTGNRCPHSHTLLPQRQVFRRNRYVLQSGLFCSMCTAWVDEPRNGRHTHAPDNSFFWQCTGGCDSGKWVYCRRCVSADRFCDHVLVMWTNTRAASTPPYQGPTPDEIISRGPAAWGPDWLRVRGYVRWEQYNIICDYCRRVIPTGEIWFHCAVCLEGQFDVCGACAGASPSRGGECASGHEMSIMSGAGAGSASIKLVWRKELQPPPMCEGWQTMAGVAQCANWPDGEDDELGFPAGAEVKDVVDAYDIAGETWAWGTWAGRGGLFPKRCLRIE